MSLQLTSAAFADGQTIPQKYSCDGEDISPPLEWAGTPDTAQSIALICEDPDAPSGTFTHWVLYDIPPAATRLSEGAEGAGKAGLNSFGKMGYGGPCPPPKDAAHRYVFRIYALDINSAGKSGLSKSELAAAMHDHVLAEGKLTGTYERKKK
jgi:Raf kinase inhibitor-like YbhB/YbcL family protein